MLCPNCRSTIKDDAAACPECGQTILTQPAEEIKTIQLRCKSCNGVLEADADSPILFCTYCGSKELIPESDDVKIERLRNQTLKEVVLGSMQHESEMARIQDARDRLQRFKKGYFSKIILVFLILSLIFTIQSFLDAEMVRAGIGLVQFILFSLAWLMGMQLVKEKKPYFHILAAAAGFLLVIPFILADSENLVNKTVSYRWPEQGLSQLLPEPPSRKGVIGSDDDSRFQMRVYQVSKDDHQAYLKSCQESGFTIEPQTAYSTFTAFNASGHKLEIMYFQGDKDMWIELNAPFPLAPFKWPSTGLAALLPQPDSDLGYIDWDSADWLMMYVGNMGKDKFNDYIDACLDQGFQVDYTRRDDAFTGHHKDGCELRLYYEGNGVMRIIMDKARDS